MVRNASLYLLPSYHCSPRSPRMRAKKGTSDRRIRKQNRTRCIRRSVSSPYHALPFRSSSLGSFKAHDILSQSQPIHSRKAVSVLKTRNLPSTVSPISSPTRVNTKFVPRKRKVRSTRELEEYEELKEKYQQRKETSKKSLRKGYVQKAPFCPHSAADRMDVIDIQPLPDHLRRDA